MLQQLTAATGASLWAELSLLFFFGSFLVIVVRLLRTPRSQTDALARLPLDDAPRGGEG